MQRERIGDLCVGRWESILTSLGVAPEVLTGKHRPCPMCGGKDRFRFDNKEGRGTWYCSHCGAGDGFKFLLQMNNWSFPQAAREVERVLGMSREDTPRSDFTDEQKRQALRRAWKQSQPVAVGDPVWEYLSGRTGIEFLPESIRYHRALPYGDVLYPAMLGVVTMPDGKPSTMHRTWLDGKGGKAPVDQPKKVMSGTIKGGAIRLAPIAECLGIAEGIETALAASVLFGMPVWAAISANGVQQWEPPAGVSSVVVFADNDENFVGQNAGYALAQNLVRRGMKAEVRIPAVVGTDWADVYTEERGNP
jgi:putative DNA primase/helicase